MDVDPWSSVEAMLKWKLADLKRRIDESLAAWPQYRDAFELPKAADDPPAEWSFGKLTHADVKTAYYMQAMAWVKQKIINAEQAIDAADLVRATRWTFEAADSLWSAGALASSADTTRIWRHIDRRRRSAAERATKGNKARTKYKAKDRETWRSVWAEMKAGNSHLRPNSAAPIIAEKLGLPRSAARTIRSELEKLERCR